MAVVMVMVVATPETRRSAFRQSITTVRYGERLARRASKLGTHSAANAATATGRQDDQAVSNTKGPKWWGQEVWHGVGLSIDMLRQPGFAIVAVYVGWIYAQIVLIIIFFGSLASRSYRWVM